MVIVLDIQLTNSTLIDSVRLIPHDKTYSRKYYSNIRNKKKNKQKIANSCTNALCIHFSISLQQSFSVEELHVLRLIQINRVRFATSEIRGSCRDSKREREKKKRSVPSVVVTSHLTAWRIRTDVANGSESRCSEQVPRRSEWRRWVVVGSTFRLCSRANFYLSAKASKKTGRERNGASTDEPARVRQCYDTGGLCPPRHRRFAIVKSYSLLKERCEHVFSFRLVPHRLVSSSVSPENRSTLAKSPHVFPELPRPDSVVR